MQHVKQIIKIFREEATSTWLSSTGLHADNPSILVELRFGVLVFAEEGKPERKNPVKMKTLGTDLALMLDGQTKTLSFSRQRTNLLTVLTS